MNATVGEEDSSLAGCQPQNNALYPPHFEKGTLYV